MTVARQPVLLHPLERDTSHSTHGFAAIQQSVCCTASMSSVCCQRQGELLALLADDFLNHKVLALASVATRAPASDVSTRSRISSSATVNSGLCGHALSTQHDDTTRARKSLALRPCHRSDNQFPGYVLDTKRSKRCEFTWKSRHAFARDTFRRNHTRGLLTPCFLQWQVRVDDGRGSPPTIWPACLSHAARPWKASSGMARALP